jgi:hypothetical protein
MGVHVKIGLEMGKWLCKSRKYKTVAGGAILKFLKKITYTVFFLLFPNPKFQMM